MIGEQAVRYSLAVAAHWNALFASILPKRGALESGAAIAIGKAQSVVTARGLGCTHSRFAYRTAAAGRVEARADAEGVIVLPDTFLGIVGITIDVLTEVSDAESAPSTIHGLVARSVRADAVTGDVGRHADVTLGTVQGPVAWHAAVDTGFFVLTWSLTGEARRTVVALGVRTTARFRPHAARW